MKFSLVQLAAVAMAIMVNAAPQATALAGCNRDNCLRALLGVASSKASSDCTAFLQTTVVEFTATVSAILTPSPGNLKKRNQVVTITPSAWPTYAACSSTVGGQVAGQRTQIAGLQRYSSACSCIGIQPTSTVSIQAVQTIPVPQFTLGLTCLNRDSYYLYFENGALWAHDYNSLTPPPAVFTLDSNNNILYNGMKIETVNLDDPSQVYSSSVGSSVKCWFPSGGPDYFRAQSCISGGSKQFFFIPGEGPGVFPLFMRTAATSCTIEAHPLGN
ncbi:hypothetical protein TWF481_006331 [Arthrobotrys musiformis]|uniref:Uncharacterized protein n=1 Tax=Arthrobotrys musiformis TaxID=47236 RepID=A0AAV9WID0_9PEZI